MNVPELTKEEYIRLELTKALIAVKWGGQTAIRSDAVYLAEGILTGTRGPAKEPGGEDATSKS
jgi:hypothetical protein